MSNPKPTPSPADKKNAQVAPPFRLKLSPNQKKRSKLQQLPEASIAQAPTAAPEPTPTAPAAPPNLLRRKRLKRSGHMHQDLTKPIPEDDPAAKETEY